MRNELEGMWKEANVFKFSIPILTSDYEQQTKTPIIIIIFGITADTQTRNASNTIQKRSRVLSQRYHVNASHTALTNYS
jgi:hypothetical protein